ncbi:MAG: LicD family protein [Clostridia bacterium]|nr:LicD family protein [Clostridia bacterium]
MSEMTISIRELQLLELDILRAVDKLCRDNELTYYLGEGSMLGAIRHQGFIPWDDDLDILMPREDYDKFLSLRDQLPATLKVQHHTTTPHYWSPSIKVRLLDNSRFAQQHIARLTDENGPYIDIFPLDTVPAEKSPAQKKQSRRFRILRALLMGKARVRPLTNWKNILFRILSRPIPYAYLHRALDEVMTAQSGPDCTYYVNNGSYYDRVKETAPIAWYGAPRYVPFEDGEYPVPQKAEELLTRIYGDYMTPPPEAERGVHHYFGENAGE